MRSFVDGDFARERVTLRTVNDVAVEIGVAEFPEADVGIAGGGERPRGVVELPAGGLDVRAMAVKRKTTWLKGNVSGAMRLRKVLVTPSVCGEAAFHENEAGAAFGIAHLSENAAGGDGADFHTAEEGGAAAPQEIDIAFDEAIAEVGGAGVDEQGVLKAAEGDVEDSNALGVGARASACEPPRGVVLWRVMDSRLVSLASMVTMGAAGGGGIECVVVGVFDDGAGTVCASNGEEGLALADVDDFTDWPGSTVIAIRN